MLSSPRCYGVLIVLMFLSFLLYESAVSSIFKTKNNKKSILTLNMMFQMSPSNPAITEISTIWFRDKAFERLEQTMRCTDSPLLRSHEFFEWVVTNSKRRLQNDKEFSQRVHVRELRRNQSILDAETKERHNKELYEKSPNYAHLDRLDKLIVGGEKAIISLEKYMETIRLEGSQTEKLSATTVLYEQKRVDVLVNRNLRDELRKDAAEYDQFVLASQEKDAIYKSSGLLDAISSVGAHERDGGKGRNQRGRRFEETSLMVLEQYLLPIIAEKYGIDVTDMLIARNVKLGMAGGKGASAELDYVVCIRTDRPSDMDGLKPKGSFCRVLGLVEVIHSFVAFMIIMPIVGTILVT